MNTIEYFIDPDILTQIILNVLWKSLDFSYLQSCNSMFMSNKTKKMTSQSTAFCELSFYTFWKKGYQVAFIRERKNETTLIMDGP